MDCYKCKKWIVLNAICLFTVVIFFICKKHEQYIPKIAVLDNALVKKKALCFKTHDKVAIMLREVWFKAMEFEKKAKSEYRKIRKDKFISEKQKIILLSKIKEEHEIKAKEFQNEILKIQNINEKLLEYLTNKLKNIIHDIAKAHSVDIVINSEVHGAIVVFYKTKKVDITVKVINKLDEIVPNVDLEKLCSIVK